MSKKSKAHRKLDKISRRRRWRSRMLALGMFFYSLALMCVPVSLYNNPRSAQSLFSYFKLVMFESFYVYFLIGFGVLGSVFMVIAENIGASPSGGLKGSALGRAVSPSERVKRAHKRSSHDNKAGR